MIQKPNTHKLEDGCGFCNEYATGLISDNMLELFKAPLFNRVIVENTNSFLVPSLGPLTRNHLLLVCKGHIPSLRDATPNLQKELIGQARNYKNVLEREFNIPFSIFENGESLAKPLGTCVSHIHIHIVETPPLDVKREISNLLDIDKGSYYFETEISAISSHHDYVYWENSLARNWFLSSREIPSQILRKIINKSTSNLDSWNWRDAPKLQQVKQMSVDLRSLFCSHGQT